MNNLKRGIILILLLSVIAVQISCVSQATYFNRGKVDKDIEKIAVLPFKNFNQVEGNHSGDLVMNMFESVLRRRGFQVIEVEKSAVAASYETLEKNEFPSKWIIETGAAIGADYMIYGSVHDYKTYQSSSSFLYLFSWLEMTSSVGITARLVSCKTGEVIWAGSFTRTSYTYNDAAEEGVTELIKTMKYKSAKTREEK